MDMFIDETWQTAVSGETITINDPCTSLSFDTVPDAGSEDADIAIVAAKRAFDSRRTGDTKADKAIAESAMGTVKRITLELGAQCPAIVCADSDLDKATTAITRHGFANSGQLCYRVNRVYGERLVYDEFLEKLSQKVGALMLAPTAGSGVLGR